MNRPNGRVRTPLERTRMVACCEMHDLRRCVAEAGGLYTRAGLARRWGVSRTIVGKWTLASNFPVPIRVDGKQDVWPADEADAWRHRPK